MFCDRTGSDFHARQGVLVVHFVGEQQNRELRVDDVRVLEQDIEFVAHHNYIHLKGGGVI